MTPKQSVAPKRAARPFELAGDVCWNARTVAQALAKHPDQGYLAIDNGALLHWLAPQPGRRCDCRKGPKRRSSPPGRAAPAALRIASCRAPSWPSTRRRRFGTAAGRCCPSASAMRWQTPSSAAAVPRSWPKYSSLSCRCSWVNVQPEARVEYAALTGHLDSARGFLERPVFGNGLERCLYELNPNMHCHSPAIEHHYVLDLEGLVHAMETIAGEPDRPREPVDRHIAAFILSRHNRVKEKLITALSAESGTADRGMAYLVLMAALQRETKVKSLPKLSAWMVDLLGPTIETFHSGTLRGRVRSHLEKEAKTGVLQRLVDIVDNANLRQRDDTGFRLASRDHALTQKAIEGHRRELENRDSLTKEIGRQIAAITGGLIATAAIVAIVLVQAM